MNLPAKIYTETELTRAKKTSKIVGWVQGAGVVIGGAIIWNMFSWIPAVLVIGGVGYVGYKLLSSGSDDGDE
ncbi:MAG: hypothetical protein ACI9OJ_005137 [Myxococcota bacterium]